MRVAGDVMPSAAFTLETIPRKPGYVLVRFYENAVPATGETFSGETYKYFTYDEYHMELKETTTIHADIAANLDVFLTQAKELEKNDPAKVTSRISTLEDEKADKTEVDAVWKQMATAYSEGVQEA